MYGRLTSPQIKTIEVAFQLVLAQPYQEAQKLTMRDIVFDVLSRAFSEDRIDDLRLWTIFTRVFLNPRLFPSHLSTRVPAFLSEESDIAAGTLDDYLEHSLLMTY